MKSYWLALAGAALLPLVACGGNVNSASSGYTIGGTVSGLTGSGLVLEGYYENNLAISANGPFTFSTPIANGYLYSVSVFTQPSDPPQFCSVANGSGTATANVTNVQVTCVLLPQYTIGGTVSGLTGSGLVLQDNGGDNLAIGANGGFTFGTPVNPNAPSYSVTVFSEPAAQVCVVSNGSGYATVNVTSVQVACYAVTSEMGEWAWMGGSSTADQPGSYGTKGVPSAGNVPGARLWACSFTDLSGNFWLFGGLGWASGTAQTDFNDLWEYSNSQWTWMGGLNQAAGPGTPAQLGGIYGTIGVPAPGNWPGARDSATCSTDPQGNFWLYGGLGFDSTGNAGGLGDLWRYSNGEWTWMNGPNIVAQPTTGGVGDPVYGTEGVAAPSNTPGWRQWASGWADPSGNLWLFGGLAAGGSRNDLWEYAPSTGEWTWIAGSNLFDQYGAYGTLGTPAPGNVPGTRIGATAWADAAGNFWLFGGLGVGTTGDNCGGLPFCILSDLWEFNPSLNEWTWVGGPDLSNQPGVYGTLGVAAPGNWPDPREDATAWTDSEGNVWLFGGDFESPFNDLWKYSNGEWTWVSGATQTCEEPGIYGTLGVPSAANYPGARTGAVGWTDKTGNLWLFGGWPCAQSSTAKLNDLWEYQP